MTPGMFVWTTTQATVLFATVLVVTSIVFSLLDNDDEMFQTMFWLVPVLTLFVWGVATVMYFVELIPKWLWILGLRLREGRARPLPSGKLAVGDDWLDSP
jgi:hypothetical protein